MRDGLIAEHLAKLKRLPGRAPAPEDLSVLMQKLYKAWSALLEHARTGRLSLFGRPVDDILGMQKPAGGIEKIPADRLHPLFVIDLRRNQLEPDIARADLSFGDFEALRHDRGFDMTSASATAWGGRAPTS